MNILVTGATGKVGSRLVPSLLQAGHNVRLLIRDPQHETAQALAAQGTELCVGDILQPEGLANALREVDAVVHLAAFFRGQDADMIRKVNVEGTKNLSVAALSANKHIRFIFASTSLVYTNEAGLAQEDEAIHPAMPYPASKAEAERCLLDLHHSQGLDVRIARFAFVYGAGDPHLAEAAPLFERWQWHPAQRLHLIHHADIAQGIKLLLRIPGLAGEIYNLADDAPITAQEVLHVTQQKAYLTAPTAPLEHPWNGLVSTEKIRALGFRPLVPSLFFARSLNVL